MKMIRIASLVALTAALALSGCSGGSSDSASKEAAKKGAELALPADVEFAAVTLDGNMGCGHCTFHTTDSCALAMKTDSGDIVVIETTPEKHDQFFSERLSEKPIHVEGKMGEVDGHLVVYTDDIALR